MACYWRTRFNSLIKTLLEDDSNIKHCERMKIILLFLCLYCSFISARVLIRVPPRYPNFANCLDDICSMGNYTGYGCIGGRCVYICQDDVCDGYSGTREQLHSLKKADLIRPWAFGARGLHGCKGGDCGFWGGCTEGYCAGRYDFRNCQKSHCQSGPFRGYGCFPNRCRIVCFDNNCHVDEFYGHRGIADKINEMVPFDIEELRRMLLIGFVEVEKSLHDQESQFWKFYLKDSSAWEMDKNDPEFWAFLFNRVGRVKPWEAQVDIPSAICDAPSCPDACSTQNCIS